MQPYFFPYAGYLALAANADLFVVLDDVKFSRGWSNRNFFLDSAGRVSRFSFPVVVETSKSHFKDVSFVTEGSKSAFTVANNLFIYLQLQHSAKARHAFEVFESHLESGLVDANIASLKSVLELSGLRSPEFIKSSNVCDEHLSGLEKVLRLCKYFGATEYLNLPGGRLLYKHEDFGAEGVALQFITPVSDSKENLSCLSDLRWSGAEGLQGKVVEDFFVSN